ncbi:MAG: HAMP domain-containing histidine kinase, partial [Verrucomicrobiota bacterium]|nr:HAMP domain-containing histidine kinase [Verrucomicrobiota bacterium]
HQLTAMLDKAVDGMLSMTQELLDYARGATSLTKTTVSVWQLLDELNEHAFQLLPGQNIRLVKQIHYDGNVAMDLPRFVRVICNLIKNAHEAMPHGGILTLGIEKAKGEIVFRVSDTGKGMPPEILSKIFEPFVTHGKTHGTGLGMAIAKSVIDAHDGSITVSSIEKTGTTVEIRLPAPA